MEQIVKCVIVGGPQHGLVRRQLWDPLYPAPPILPTDDGQLCVAAAQRVRSDNDSYFVLLHPQATGKQFLDILSTLGACA